MVAASSIITCPSLHSLPNPHLWISKLAIAHACLPPPVQSPPSIPSENRCVRRHPPAAACLGLSDPNPCRCPSSQPGGSTSPPLGHPCPLPCQPLLQNGTSQHQSAPCDNLFCRPANHTLANSHRQFSPDGLAHQHRSQPIQPFHPRRRGGEARREGSSQEGKGGEREEEANAGIDSVTAQLPNPTSAPRRVWHTSSIHPVLWMPH